jgi:hypothetical protein
VDHQRRRETLYRNPILFFVSLTLLSCGSQKSTAGPKPPEGQVLRDAEAVMAGANAKAQSYGLRGATNFRVKEITPDPYEKDMCTATVLYDAMGDMTGVVALSYRRAGDFWKCTAGKDMGMGYR